MEKEYEMTDNNYPIELNSYQDINIYNELFSCLNYYSQEQLSEFILNPMQYHKQILDISEKLYNRNGIFAQTINKMVASPSLDGIIIPNHTSSKSKQDIEAAYRFMDKINHKLMTRDSMFNELLYGEYVAILRDTKKKNSKRPSAYATGKTIEGAGFIENVMLQPLDLRYCRFEGFANGDYVISFDLEYFDLFKGANLVGEIKNYPDYFLRGYNIYRKDHSKKWLLLPQKTTFARKYHGAVNESHGRPLVLSAIEDILFAEDYTDSQRNNMYENGNTIRWMRLPEGEKKGTCSLNQQQQNNQYNAFKNAVRRASSDTKRKIGGTTTLKLAPGTEIGKLDCNDTFLNNTLTKENNNEISSSLGFPISALSGGSSGSNYATLSLSLNLVLAEIFSMLEQYSFQYTKLINAYLGLNEERSLAFNYINTSTINSDKEFAKYKELYTLAGGSRIYLYSAACGNSNLYLKLMDFEKSQQFDEKYLPHGTSFTTSDKTNTSTGGRPQKDESELTDTGLSTRQNGSNKQAKASKNR